MQKKYIPWVVLGVLFVLAVLGFGLRQGISVGEKNALSSIEYKNIQLSLTPHPTIHKPVTFTTMRDETCGVDYLLPETVASDEAAVSIRCESTFTASATATLEKEGYTPVTIVGEGRSPGKKLWINAAQNVKELVMRSMRFAADN